IEPIHLGQHPVDDGDVVRTRQRQSQAGFAVGRVIDDVAGFLQSVDQITLGLEIIFYNKNAHAGSSRFAMDGSAPATATGGWGLPSPARGPEAAGKSSAAPGFCNIRS